MLGPLASAGPAERFGRPKRAPRAISGEVHVGGDPRLAGLAEESQQVGAFRQPMDCTALAPQCQDAGFSAHSFAKSSAIWTSTAFGIQSFVSLA